MNKGQSQIVSVVLITAITIGIVSSTYFWGVPLIEKSRADTEINEAEMILTEILENIEEVAMSGGQKVLNLNLKGDMFINSEENSIEYILRSKDAKIGTSDWVPLNDQNPYTRKIYGISYQSVYPVSVGVPECGRNCKLVNDCTSENKIIMIDCTDIVGGSGGEQNYADGDKFTCGSGDNQKTFTVEANCSKGSHIIIKSNEDIGPGIKGINKPGVIIARSQGSEGAFVNTYKLIFRELGDQSTKDGVIYDIKGEGTIQVSPGKHNLIISKGDVKGSTSYSSLGGDLTEIEIKLSFQ